MEYKIDPVNKYTKKEFKIGRKNKTSKPIINRIFGMSLDEMERCKQSKDWWADNKYPLVYERMYRGEVANYVNKNHSDIANPPRSSCYFCPFHSNMYWKQLKLKHPDVFEQACEADEIIRHYPGMKHKCYLHRSLKPLRDINFDQLEVDIFGECEGYCGI
jgi:hypothetical protein